MCLEYAMVANCLSACVDLCIRGLQALSVLCVYIFIYVL